MWKQTSSRTWSCPRANLLSIGSQHYGIWILVRIERTGRINYGIVEVGTACLYEPDCDRRIFSEPVVIVSSLFYIIRASRYLAESATPAVPPPVEQTFQYVVDVLMERTYRSQGNQIFLLKTHLLRRKQEHSVNKVSLFAHGVRGKVIPSRSWRDCA